MTVFLQKVAKLNLFLSSKFLPYSVKYIVSDY